MFCVFSRNFMFAVLFLTLIVGTLGKFTQIDETAYLSSWPTIQSAAYTVPLPSDLQINCKGSVYTQGLKLDSVFITGLTVYSNDVQTICGFNKVCIINAGTTLVMNSNLNLAALIIRGTLIWNDTTQSSLSQWLCGGYIVTEGSGKFLMSVTEASRNAYIYIKDNGAFHNSTFGNRVFGARSVGTAQPTIDITGRPLKRTWSLLAVPTTINANYLSLTHDPVAMGWKVGDRIVVASMLTRTGNTESQAFTITSLTSVDNRVYLSGVTNQIYDAKYFWTGQEAVATMASEVINLSRNLVITGDDFRHISCDPALPLLGTPILIDKTHGSNPNGCSCNPFIQKTTCTIGLHTIMAGKGLMKMQYTRVEKCGQRGILGRYCMHMHYLNKSPDSLFKGNAVEFSQHRGIIVHETHLAAIEDNVMSDVRGSGIYVQDGNEMWNKFKYNVVICPFALNGVLHGCTLPGTDNEIADSALEQSAYWAISPSNDLIGNRFSGAVSGLFLDLDIARYGKEAAYQKIDADFALLGRMEGNVNHDMDRFGIWIKFYFPKQCNQDVDNNGFLTPLGTICNGFTPTGLDNGRGGVFEHNLDYYNFYLGGYRYGDLQFKNQMSIDNFNLNYWRESKNFQDGCSSHILGGYYRDGRFFVPDGATFIMENTIIRGDTVMRLRSITFSGFLFMPTIILANVDYNPESLQWVTFEANANYGGIYSLPPNEETVQTGRGFFPTGYISLVSSQWSFLLDFGSNICRRTIDMNNAFPGVSGVRMADRYDNGIFCKRAMRGLKIYPRNLNYLKALPMLLEVYQGATRISSFRVSYWQVSSTDSSPPLLEQGYSFPVITGTDYEYRVSLVGTDGISRIALPTDWVIEFSDPVFGNRWVADKMILTVEGRSTDCNKKLVTSQHDRRWLYADNRDAFADPSVWGRGACNSNYPDMPTINCANVPALSMDYCAGQCGVASCNNGYCECGIKQCVCNPGYYGADCSQNVNDGTYCGTNGQSIAKYLGGTLPVTKSTCVCDPGWSGPTCELNPCAGQTCSNGRGKCVTKNENDWKCECDQAYHGTYCEKDRFTCPCNDSFLATCGQGDDGRIRMCSIDPVVALTSPGCFSRSYYMVPKADQCCYSDCEKCSLVNCPKATNDCRAAGACVLSTGVCSAETLRADGSRCNSIPYGVCMSGVCTATTTVVTSTQPPSVTPSVKPSRLPSIVPSAVSVTKMPSVTPSVAPVTVSPTTVLSESPVTVLPTVFPSESPVTVLPTVFPSAVPSIGPSVSPSAVPTVKPSNSPSYTPTIIPSYAPSVRPSLAPIGVSAVSPTAAPTRRRRVLCPDQKTYCSGCQFCPGGFICPNCVVSPPTVTPTQTPVAITNLGQTQDSAGKTSGGMSTVELATTISIVILILLFIGVMFCLTNKCRRGNISDDDETNNNDGTAGELYEMYNLNDSERRASTGRLNELNYNSSVRRFSTTADGNVNDDNEVDASGFSNEGTDDHRSGDDATFTHFNTAVALDINNNADHDDDDDAIVLMGINEGNDYFTSTSQRSRRVVSSNTSTGGMKAVSLGKSTDCL